LVGLDDGLTDDIMRRRMLESPFMTLGERLNLRRYFKKQDALRRSEQR
jgi:hypothetical protein